MQVLFCINVGVDFPREHDCKKGEWTPKSSVNQSILKSVMLWNNGVELYQLNHPTTEIEM